MAPLKCSFPLITGTGAGGKGTPASSTPATSSPPPTLSDDFPIISLPANTVQSSPPRKVWFHSLTLSSEVKQQQKSWFQHVVIFAVINVRFSDKDPNRLYLYHVIKGSWTYKLNVWMFKETTQRAKLVQLSRIVDKVKAARRYWWDRNQWKIWRRAPK